MKIADTYYLEDQADGLPREFWVRAGGYVRHTLEFQGGGDVIEVVWNTDSLDSIADIESRGSMEISRNDALKMIATLQRLVKSQY
ncbi:hypothetical protein ABT274_12280 [Streptomyces sp. NPDC001127]|uniref:hypothetical protein n=1 Tax=Streptomyces sp. NPDC001127 TaxID=3154377 RepID=UPI0033268477